jgi:hypothetical protein
MFSRSHNSRIFLPEDSIFVMTKAGLLACVLLSAFPFDEQWSGVNNSLDSLQLRVQLRHRFLTLDF